MPNTCETCSSYAEIDGVSVCRFSPPMTFGRDPKELAFFPRVPPDWWCRQHSDETPLPVALSEPILTTLSNGLRANLGSLTPIAGLLSLPSVSGIRQYDYFRVSSDGTLFSVARAAGDLIVSTKDSPNVSTSGDWLVI